MGKSAGRRSDDGDSGRDMLAVSRDEGRSRRRHVSPGKCADVIAVKGDVLRYIALLQRVDIVIKHGKQTR